MPMIAAKALSLSVRPVQVSNLCFEVGGILGESFTELGATVSASDFAGLYRAFRDGMTDPNRPNDPGTLLFDSHGIDAVVKIPFVVRNPFVFKTPDKPNNPPIDDIVKDPPEDDPDGPFPKPKQVPPPAEATALAALRAETVKAALNKAVIARKNAFITKYGKVAEIASVLKDGASVKSARLTRLQNRSQQRTNDLLFAYQHSGRDESDVVTKTITDIVAKTHEGPFLTTTKVVDEKTTTSRAPHEFLVSANQVKDNDLAEAVETQRIENFGYDFRMPFIEEDMRNDQDQNTISDQFISLFLQSHYLDRLEEVYKNEVAAMDADINQLQVAYLNTILLSPIDGVITGVYKNPGDAVRPGEPVLRVEDNSQVFLVAKIVCRGPISIGSILQVTTTLFDMPSGSPVPIEAEVVAVRGEGEDDQWEVIAKHSNLDASGNTIFPLGYHFDYDNTEVNVFEANEI